VVVDRQEELGRAFSSSIGAEFAAADVTDAEQVAAVVERASDLAPLRVLVNCAGVGRAARTVGKDGAPLAMKAFEFVIRVNLLGTFNCARLAAAAMAQTEPGEDRDRGVILNTASVAAFDGQIGQVAYAASKAGVAGMTLPMARDLASAGIRVNTIAPGLFDTPIYGSGEAAEQFKKQLGTSVVFPRRLGTSEEFATLALEIVTNSYLNGEVIRLDGAIRLPPR
jgi:NAD(P)-dependent dehydrogenase (short-subunit alcohol dehydrogenase family)